MTNNTLPDLQNTKDTRGIAIDRVGITDAYFPIRVLTKSGGYADVSALTKLFVGLPQEYKGVNMSRFMISLRDFDEAHIVSLKTMPLLLELLQERLVSADSYARFEFDYYIDKSAPVSGETAPQKYRCAFTGIKKSGDPDLFILEINVVAASVCPCSKEMSLLENLDESSLGLPFVRSESSILRDVSKLVGMGAHNQRSNIRVEAVVSEERFIWIEDLVKLVEEQASAPTFPILKRADEKRVTEAGYSCSKFSEDIARDVQIALESHSDIVAWKLKVENEESIHPYNVTAVQQSQNWKAY